MIISIDIGTSYSCMSMLNEEGRPVSVEVGDSAYGSKYSMPTAVYLEKDGTLLKGQAAVNQKLVLPQNYRDNFKRDFGIDDQIPLGERTYRVEELYTEIFDYMMECLKRIVGDEQIEKVYLTYPASYRKAKKDKLLSAAVCLPNVTLVEEPVAAAMDQCACKKVKVGQTVLIYDFGGGTFDAALVKCEEGSFSIVGVPSGEEYCGGIDIDRKIFYDISEAIKSGLASGPDPQSDAGKRFYRTIGDSAVKVKHQLSNAKEATVNIPVGWDIVPYTLTRDNFDHMIAPLVGKTISCCEELIRDSGVKKGDISAVIMVGGTSRIPLVQSMVKQFAGSIPVFMAQDPDLTVVQGALNYHVYQKNDQDPEALYQKATELKEKNGYTDEMIALYHKAAEMGHAASQYEYIMSVMYNDDITKEEIFDWLTKSAEQGYPMAQYELGWQYEVCSDMEKAVYWWRKAAENGDICGIESLADYYYDGEKTEPDYEEAVKWYRKGAEMGDTYSQFSIGYCYHHGDGVEQNYNEAANWYCEAAMRGNPKAQCNLGYFYEYGLGVEKNAEEAARWYRKAAEKGFSEAQYNLGLCYRNGTGVTRDIATAEKWFRKAAEQGDEDAVEMIKSLDEYKANGGRSYAESAPQEEEGSFEWYMKAARSGDADAQYRVAVCYEDGEGVEQNFEEAVKWLQKAADKKHLPAITRLGIYYSEGIEVDKNLTKAVMLYRKAAMPGYAEAQNLLGAAYYNGEGLVQSFDDAVLWFQRAAEQGFSNAQYNLGLCYRDGTGVKRDIATSEKWFRKAAEQGDEDAVEGIKSLDEYKANGGRSYEEIVREVLSASRVNVRDPAYSIATLDRLFVHLKVLQKDRKSVILAHDDTIFKSGRSGFVITGSGVYAKEDFLSPHFVSWERFAKGRKIVDAPGCLYIDSVDNRNLLCYKTGGGKEELFEFYCKLLEEMKKK